MMLFHKFHYAFGGLILIAIGVLTILFELGITSLDANEFPIVRFAIYLLIAFAAKDLLVEGFKEKESSLKYPSIILAIILIIITTIPILNEYDFTSFVIPEYSPIIDGVLYTISGLFLFIGTFTLLATKE